MEEMNGTSATCVQYVREILEEVGYSPTEAQEKAHYLATGFSDHSAVLGRELLVKKGFNVVEETKYPKEWKVMRQWLRRHIGASGSIHHMRYCLPKKAKSQSPVTTLARQGKKAQMANLGRGDVDGKKQN